MQRFSRVAAAALAACLVVPAVSAQASSTDTRHAVAGVRTVNFPGDGASITRADQVGELRGTSASFKQFIEKRINYLVRNDCYEAGEVNVFRWRSDGWATANESSCGGAQYIYMRTSRGWRAPNALAAQEALFCSVLRRYDVPPKLLATRSGPYQCYGSDGMTMVAYQ